MAEWLKVRPYSHGGAIDLPVDFHLSLSGEWLSRRDPLEDKPEVTKKTQKRRCFLDLLLFNSRERIVRPIC